MASTVRCEYCGSAITAADKLCPHCGASNPLYVEDAEAIITDPKTIEELQEYCTERGMPLLRMRFFIGEDVKEPKAFGIYRESDGEIVVYKNKADGSRAERYRGRDEAFAVGEIFQKLLDECHARGIYPDGKSAEQQRSAQTQKAAHVGGSPGISPGKLKFGFWAIVLAVFLLSNAGRIRTAIQARRYPDGYYVHDDSLYYRYDDKWYAPDAATEDWTYVSDAPDYNGIDSTEYTTWNSGEADWNDWDTVSFTDSAMYAYLLTAEDSDSGYADSDYDSSYDSWDSGSTDWNSDW